MGISSIEGLALLSLSRGGRIGDDILSLGRPELFMTKRDLEHIARGLGLSWNGDAIARIVQSKYGEILFEHAGFRTIRSLDASNYEGAQIVHDLNNPIPKALEGTTRFLFTNGTIEHVFNIATALDNVKRLLCTGGSVLFTGPANGQCGHGFYQFSPEFLYRFFEVNGFEDVRVYVVGRKPPQRWFRAKDPSVLKERVEFTTMEPTEIIAIARKAREQSGTPQQSDYARTLWTSNDQKNSAWSPKSRTLSSMLYNKVVFPGAVGLRYVAGLGMPGLDGNHFFESIDPLRTEL